MSHDSGKMPADVAGDATVFYEHLTELLACGERLALCTVIRLAGSGPRRAGAKMLVRDGGGSVGTIGGGVLEKEVAAWAREVLRTGRALCRSFALDLQQASDEGMTCGGEVEVLVEPLDGTPAVQDFFAQVLTVLRRGERGCLVTAISQDGDGVATERFLVAGGRSAASLSATGHTLPGDLLCSPTPPAPQLVERGTIRYFLEPLAPPITVYIFGGGHIAVRLAPLCHLLGFRTVVVDDRADFASRDRFPQASELVVAPSFDHALEDLPIGEDGYVVIVTRGHGGDEAVLRQALRRRPGYIGMIGSLRKRALVFEQLTREGFDSEDLARVVCPVGLPIGAETPEEIAVSIAAQLVATRAARRGKG
jgi:xanthine dehydrogenase accessory factor